MSTRAPHGGWLLTVLLAGPFMAQADATITNVATPSIHTDLGASGAALELVVGGYLIAFAVLLITGAFTAIGLLASAAAHRATRRTLVGEAPLLLQQ
jgi:MFS family permease